MNQVYIWPQLKADIEELVEPHRPHSQADPRFQTPFAYTRITARGVREALKEHKGYREEELPSENTLGNILNRMGYRLRQVEKAKPKKRFRKRMRASRTFTNATPRRITTGSR